MNKWDNWQLPVYRRSLPVLNDKCMYNNLNKHGFLVLLHEKSTWRYYEPG